MSGSLPAYLETLKAGLLAPEPPLLESAAPQAAVLLLLCEQPELHTYLTLRSNELPTHAGQVSLPGGRVEVSDASLEMTALREAQEETRLDPAGVTLLGRLSRVQVSSGVEITPVVGWCEQPPALEADPREVAELFSWPLAELLEPQRYRRETLLRAGQQREFWVIELGRHRVWGATAAILYSLASLARECQLSLPR